LWLHAAWYTGSIEGNFALLLFLATVVTGAVLAGRALYFWPAPRALPRWSRPAERRAELDRMGIAKTDIDVSEDARAASSCSPGGWTGPPACSR
jgi:signal peptidase I